MKRHWMLISSTSVAVVLAVALVLRPSRSIVEPRLPVPAHIPADVRAALQARMQQHGAQMTELLLALVVLDHDRAARIAGTLYEETAVDGGPAGGGSAQFLPKRFFALQAQLKDQARLVVVAAAERNPERVAESFGALTKTCVSCHQVYLQEGPEDGPAK